MKTINITLNKKTLSEVYNQVALLNNMGFPNFQKGEPIHNLMREIKKEVKKKRFHNDTSDLMDSRNTTLYNQKNGNEIQSDEDYKEENDGPTLVFDDFDQSADLEVPAYIRKQNR